MSRYWPPQGRGLGPQGRAGKRCRPTVAGSRLKSSVARVLSVWCLVTREKERFRVTGSRGAPFFAEET